MCPMMMRMARICLSSERGAYRNCHREDDAVDDAGPVAVGEHGLPERGEEAAHAQVVDDEDENDEGDVAARVVVEAVQVLRVVLAQRTHPHQPPHQLRPLLLRDRRVVLALEAAAPLLLRACLHILFFSSYFS